ncbi:MAG: zinc ribbon domain-containing protein [Bacteroidales bacterium]
MIICVNCGVELDDGFKVCPLCGKDPENKIEQEYVSNTYPSDIIRVQRKENRRYLWELSGILAFSGIAGCTIIELLISKELKWSLLSDVSIFTAWVILTLYQFAFKKTLMVVTCLIATVLTSLYFLDMIAAGREWFFPVGLPVTGAVFISFGIVIFLYKAAPLKGLNLIASAIMVLSGFCIILELILDNYLTYIIDLRWSLIVAVSVLPVALLLFFYHYRLKKGNRLDSFFHI